MDIHKHKHVVMLDTCFKEFPIISNIRIQYIKIQNALLMNMNLTRNMEFLVLC